MYIMKGTGKFLTAVFVVLFIVLLGELGYVLYSTSQTKNTPKEGPVPTLTIEQVETIKARPKNPAQAINQDLLDSMAKANRGVLISAILRTTNQGNVTEYTLDGSGLKIKLTGTTGESNAFYYDSEQLKKVTFFKNNLITGETKKISASEVQMGDLVRIEGDMDAMKDLKDSFIGDKITVITQ